MKCPYLVLGRVSLLIATSVYFHIHGAGADQSGFTPGCSFVGGQCMYTVQLGHQNQCDIVQSISTTDDASPGCCTTLKNDVTGVQNEIQNLKSQLALLQAKFNESGSNMSQVQSNADKIEAERDALLNTLKQKEAELNSTQTELSKIISQAGKEIKTLRDALTNATTALTACRTALGVPTPTGTVDPALASNADVKMSYCAFDTLTDCGYKTLTSTVAFTSMSKGQTSSTGPRYDHSTGVPSGKYVALNVYGISKYTSSSERVLSATIESDMFDPALAYCIKFWYSMKGQDVYGLDVNVRIGGGTGYPVWSKRGDQKVDWKLGEVELDSEYTANPFKIDFVAMTNFWYESRYSRYHNRYGDVGIDDVYVYNTTCSAIPRCPPNAVKHSFGQVTSCYTLHAEPKKWFDAFEACRLEGPETGLVSIESQAEQDFLVNLITNDPVYNAVGSGGFWTGGNDLASEHYFAWTDTGARRVLNYTNWHVGQPNNVGGSQDCLLLEYPNDKFSWGDQSCTAKHAFICEIYY